MRRSEQVELALIFGATLVAWLLAPLWPARIPATALALATAVLLLGQGLVRDLWLLVRMRWRDQATKPSQAARCMCLESLVGVVVIVAAAVLLGAGIDRMLVMPGGLWGLWLLAVAVLGFLLKDLVISTTPWRIHRERDHANILFTLKR